MFLKNSKNEPIIHGEDIHNFSRTLEGVQMVFLEVKLIHQSKWESSMRHGWMSHVIFPSKFIPKYMDVPQMSFTWVLNDFFHPNSFQSTSKMIKGIWKGFELYTNVKFYIQFSSR